MWKMLIDKSLHYFPNFMLLVTLHCIFAKKNEKEKYAFAGAFFVLCFLDWIRLNVSGWIGISEGFLYVLFQLLIVVCMILAAWGYGIGFLQGWSLYKLLAVFMWWFCYESSRVVAFGVTFIKIPAISDIWLHLVIQNILVTLCSLWIIRLKVNYSVHISKRLILAIGILSMFVEEIVYNRSGLEFLETYFKAGPAIIIYIMFSNLFLYWCIAEIIRKMEFERKNETYRLLKEMELRSVTQRYDDTRRLRHEIKNQMLVMDTLISEKRYEELRSVFERFSIHAERLFQKKYCENQMLNAILNYESQKSQDQGVKLDVLAFMPKEISIDLVDLTTILVNLMDNAIEASAVVDQPEVQVSVKKEKNYIFIKVCNRVVEDILKDNPDLQTTKPEKELHGNGIALIRMAVEKYDGDIQFSQNHGEFQVSAMLKDTVSGGAER